MNKAPTTRLAQAILVITFIASMLHGQYIQQTVPPTPFSPIASPVMAGGVCDLDNNGLPDVVYFDSFPQFMVLLNPGVNGITTPTSVYPTTQATPLALGSGGVALKDMNGDGIIDVTVRVPDQVSSHIYIWLGLGNGALAVPPIGPLPVTDMRGTVVDDFNGDGLNDLLVYRQTPYLSGSYYFDLVLNMGGNSFARVWSRTLPQVRTLSVGDFDNDGMSDLAYTHFYDPFVHVLYGTPTGRFLPEMLINPGSIVGGQVVYGGFNSPFSFPSTDLDADGCDDLLVALAYTCSGSPPTRLRRLYGTNTKGVFVDGGNSLPTTICGGFQPLVSDWDADGNTDVMIYRPLQYSTGDVQIEYYLMRGLGGRQFEQVPIPYIIPLAPVPTSLALEPNVGDFDGDGDPDIIGTPSIYTTYFENRAIFGTGCAGTIGVPAIRSAPPTLGNLGYRVEMTGAAALSPAVLAISTNRLTAPPIGTPLISLAPGNLVLPLGSLGFTMTDAAGDAQVNLPLPFNLALRGTTLFAQWAVADPLGVSVAPITGLALSRGRTIILW